MAIWDTDHPSMWPAASSQVLAYGDTTQALAQMIVAGRSLGTFGDFHRSILASSAYRAHLEEANGHLTELLRLLPASLLSHT